MTAETDLLPLPGSVADWLRRFGAANGSIQSEVIEGWFRHYARANVAPLQAEIEALRAEVERANSWNERVSVCPDHVADIVDGPCVICALDAAEARADNLRAEVERLQSDTSFATAISSLRREKERAERLAEALRKIAALTEEFDDLDDAVGIANEALEREAGRG